MFDIGQTVNDTYEIKEKIGSGGGGVIFKAYHLRMRKNVAIKLIKDNVKGMIQDRTEVDLLKDLKHPYLPQVLDFFEEGSDVYTVMEFIDGQNFKQLINSGKSFDEKQGKKYAVQLCEAVQYLHDHTPPIIHSDIKPANIMLTSNDDICLIDFNISAVSTNGGAYSMGGSKGFAAPEQFKKIIDVPVTVDEFHEETRFIDEEDATELLMEVPEQVSVIKNETAGTKNISMAYIDVRTDVYGIGASLYYILTGRVPHGGQLDFRGTGVSGQFRKIIKKAADPLSEKRYKNVSEMLSAIKKMSSGAAKAAAGAGAAAAAIAVIAAIAVFGNGGSQKEIEADPGTSQTMPSETDNTDKTAAETSAAALTDDVSEDTETSAADEPDVSDEPDVPDDENDKEDPPDIPGGISGVSAGLSEDMKYTHSANIVNGGHSAYDGESYFLSSNVLSRVDKNGGSEVIFDKTVYYLNSNDDSIFFVSSEDNHIYRMKKDGSGLTDLYSHTSRELTLYEDKLYFCSDMGTSSYHICSMNTDGSGLAVLSDCNEWYMNIYEGRIYFTDYDSGRQIKVMNLDGSGEKTLCSDACYDLCAADGCLYFTVNSDPRHMYRMDLASGDMTVIREKYTRFINYYNGRLFFVDENGNISSCDKNGDNEKTEYSSGNFSYITILPEKLFYCDSTDSSILTELPLN